MKTINKIRKVILLLATIVLLKMVKVKRTVFTLMREADDIRKYIEDCVTTGSAATLFKDPNIPLAFYAAGTTAAGNITAAIKVWKLAPTEGNLAEIDVRRTEGVAWLELYANQVEVIANMDANRATREAAAANIMLSHLTPQKLISSTKGKPETPVIIVTISGANKMLIEVTNGETYIPSETNFILVQLPAFTTLETPDPIVKLENGQITVTYSTGATITKSVLGKGKSTIVNFATTGCRYAGYAYAQNGKKLLSDLSEKIIVQA